jgi:hydrogenase maturation factor
MCIATIATIDEAWDDRGVRVGRLHDGSVVPLVYVPDADAGSVVLVHLGIPVEVLDPDAQREESSE